MELLVFCFALAWFIVRDGPTDLLAVAKGETPPGHTARMRRQELAHRRHLARIRAGNPTLSEAVAERIAQRIATPRRPREHSDRSTFGRFWWELWDDSWDYARDKRHQHRDKHDAGELPRQRAWRWTRHQVRRARDQVGHRTGRAQRQRRVRIHVEPQRIWPDPTTGDPEIFDLDPEPPDDPGRTRQDPGPVWMYSEPSCPAAPGTPRQLPPPRPDIGPGVGDAQVVAGQASDPSIRKAGVPMEIFNPDSARAAAACLEAEVGELIATLDRQAGELDAVHVTGAPREAYAEMIDAATHLRDTAANAGVAFATHQEIHDVVHSDESVGDGDYLEVNPR